MSEAFEKLELNKLNVLRLMQKCKKTAASTNVVIMNFYDDELKDKAPLLEFDKDKLLENKDAIRYLLGQLHAVHAGKKFMSLPYALMNYKGENWTDDNMALYALLYLGCASLTLPKFSQAMGGALCPITDFKSLKPAFWPPKDE